MVCNKCKKCGWYRTDLCGGLWEYSESLCPIEEELEQKKLGEFIWGEKR